METADRWHEISVRFNLFRFNLFRFNSPRFLLRPVEYDAFDLGFDRSRVSVNALAVIDRLQGAGFDGYLVGGCVRDLLLNRQPKDFDVTTNASPEQIRKLFDRARIIGRRFKLIHVTYGRGWQREVIEVATYRASPKSGTKSAGRRNRTIRTGRILDDNVYGSIDADATRRDFTINALYYDPGEEIVLDFVRGIEDIRARKLSVIGDTETRFAEDPVRMLRVVRFQAKLNLVVGSDVISAINKYASLIEDVPAARMFEEILKLFHYQSGWKTWQALRQTPLTQVLFPETFRTIQDKDGHQLEALINAALKNTDARVSSDQPVIAGFIFAVFLWGPFKQELGKQHKSGMRGDPACLLAGEKVLKVQDRTVSVPWRAKSSAIGIWELQASLELRRPKATGQIMQRRWFRAAYDFLSLRSQIGEIDPEIVNWWTLRQEDYEFARDVDSVDPVDPRVNSETYRKQYQPMNKARSGQPGPGNKTRSRRRRRNGNSLQQN